MIIRDDNHIPNLLEQLDELSCYSLEIGIFGEDDSFMVMLANVHEFGCTIHPKNGKYLALPLSKKYRGKSPRSFDDLFFMETKNGNAFLAREKGKNQLEFAYALKKEVIIPERSFIRSTFDHQEKDWSDYVTRLLNQLIGNKITAKELFEKLGIRIQKDIQKTIREISDPPNVSLTTKNKGSSNPLVDTGRLRQSVTFKVVNR